MTTENQTPSNIWDYFPLFLLYFVIYVVNHKEHVLFYLLVHPSSTVLYGVGFQKLQYKQRHPDFPYTYCSFSWGIQKRFLENQNTRSPQHCLGLPCDPLKVGIEKEPKEQQFYPQHLTLSLSEHSATLWGRLLSTAFSHDHDLMNIDERRNVDWQ